MLLFAVNEELSAERHSIAVKMAAHTSLIPLEAAQACVRRLTKQVGQITRERDRLGHAAARGGKGAA